MEHAGMVHALTEIWRVLAPGGSLLDLRPLAGHSPVEVIHSRQVTLAGRLEDSATNFADDAAAQSALVAAQGQGLFVRERQAEFDFAWYWDAPDEMQAYIAERWTETHLPDRVLAEVRRQMGNAGQGARVRVRSRIVISRWRKVPGTWSTVARPGPTLQSGSHKSSLAGEAT